MSNYVWLDLARKAVGIVPDDDPNKLAMSLMVEGINNLNQSQEQLRKDLGAGFHEIKVMLDKALGKDVE